MADSRERPLVHFREVILHHLREKQDNRCADCGHRIEQLYQERVVYITEPDDGEGDTFDNLKMIHFDCTKAHSIVDTRAQRAMQLLDEGMSVHQVSIILQVSERTVQRYAHRRKKFRRSK